MYINDEGVSLKETTKQFIGIKPVFQKQAKKHAEEKGSYVIPVYKIIKGRGFKREREFVGWAVPK